MNDQLAALITLSIFVTGIFIIYHRLYKQITFKLDYIFSFGIAGVIFIQAPVVVMLIVLSVYLIFLVRMERSKHI